jgi:hypothetical protein
MKHFLNAVTVYALLTGAANAQTPQQQDPLVAAFDEDWSTIQTANKHVLNDVASLWNTINQLREANATLQKQVDDLKKPAKTEAPASDAPKP